MKIQVCKSKFWSFIKFYFYQFEFNIFALRRKQNDFWFIYEKTKGKKINVCKFNFRNCQFESYIFYKSFSLQNFIHLCPRNFEIFPFCYSAFFLKIFQDSKSIDWFL